VSRSEFAIAELQRADTRAEAERNTAREYRDRQIEGFDRRMSDVSDRQNRLESDLGSRLIRMEERLEQIGRALGLGFSLGRETPEPRSPTKR
jgi:hypothetical protein